MDLRVPIRKGQLWRKKARFHSASVPPFYAEVIGSKGTRWKTVCSDGNTHTFLPHILYQKFDLIEQ